MSDGEHDLVVRIGLVLTRNSDGAVVYSSGTGSSNELCASGQDTGEVVRRTKANTLRWLADQVLGGAYGAMGIDSVRFELDVPRS